MRASVIATGVAITLSACGGSGSGPATITPPAPSPPAGQPVLDLAGQPTGNGFHRVSGSASTGRFGVPVASGADCDNDGLMDYAMSAMVAAPFGRTAAGQVHLVFGDGSLAGADIDTAMSNTNVLTIAGAGPNEIAGSEIWIDDVTGDGIGDLLIGRQNYREPTTDRLGAGALSIVIGGSELRDLAIAGTTLDLAAVAGARVLTLVGANELDRFGFWFRTGDVTGDGIADILVGADQEDTNGENNSGSAWLIRGGAHLDASADIDLAGFGTTTLAGHVLRIEPPAGSEDYH
ncbi:MAG: FG-GAP repeat protein, partial [Gammaproteobacteria bacterium]|nr:FG-GAP repeat protein [Gammaproteobacteria bacterium]NNM20708.1 hypothetical protein [Gammaproteobacteria bacterium]